jgi:hypothetical protein
MSLMMRQAPKTRDSELTVLLTQSLVKYYTNLGIRLKYEDISTTNTEFNDF